MDERWYERRKRDLTLAMLPRERFVRGLEVAGSDRRVGGREGRRPLRVSGRHGLQRRGRGCSARDRGQGLGASGGRRAPGPCASRLARGHVRPRRRLRGRLLPEPPRSRRPHRACAGLPHTGRCRAAVPLASSHRGVAARRRARSTRRSRRHTFGRCRGATPNGTSKRSCCAPTRPGRTPTHDGPDAGCRARGHPGAQRGRADRTVPDVGPRRRCPPARQHGSRGDRDRRRRQLHGLDRRGRRPVRRRGAHRPGPMRRSSSRRRRPTRARSLETVGRIASVDCDDRCRLHGHPGLAGSPASVGDRRDRPLDRGSAAGPREHLGSGAG